MLGVCLPRSTMGGLVCVCVSGAGWCLAGLGCGQCWCNRATAVSSTSRRMCSFNTRQESPVEFHCLASVNVFVGHRGNHSALVLAHLARIEQCRMSSLMLVCHGVSPSPLFTSSHDELPQALLVECRFQCWVCVSRGAQWVGRCVYRLPGGVALGWGAASVWASAHCSLKHFS